MDSTKKPIHENPRKNANWLSQLLFLWMFPMLIRGWRKGLTLIDMTNCLDNDKSQKLGDKLEREWIKETKRATKKKKRPSLACALYKTFRQSTYWDGLLCFVFVACRSIIPIILGKLLHQVEVDWEEAIQKKAKTKLDTQTIPLKSQNDTNLLESTMYIVNHNSYFLAGLLSATSLIGVLCDHHVHLRMRMLGARLRIACCSMIYRKTLKLSKKSSGHLSTGYLINLLSNDVSRLDYGFIFSHYLWITPLQILFIVYNIWYYIKYAAIVGIFGLIIVATPTQIALSVIALKIRRQIAQRTDNRVSIMSELIQGIQVIKMYAWEIPFIKVVANTRKNEIDMIRYASYVRGINSSITYFIERTTLFLTLLACDIFDFPITTDLVFSLAQFYNVLMLTAAVFCSLALLYGSEGIMSIKRIEEYLLLDEEEGIVNKTEENNKGWFL